MKYQELKDGIQELDPDRQALLTLLFFSGCRISEALALTANDITCSGEFIYVNFYRLKGSKQTDPQALPRKDALIWLCDQEGKIFDFCRTTAYRTVKKVFPNLYPHYYRLNRVTKTIEKFGAATVVNTLGLSLQAIQHYIGKIDISKVGESLKEEID